MFEVTKTIRFDSLFEKHDANVVMCDSDLSSQLKVTALSAFKKLTGNVEEVDLPKLMSGAGHDPMAMSHLTKVGMLCTLSCGNQSFSGRAWVGRRRLGNK